MRMTTWIGGMAVVLLLGGLLAMGGCKGDKKDDAKDKAEKPAACKALSVCAEALKKEKDPGVSGMAQSMSAIADKGEVEGCKHAMAGLAVPRVTTAGVKVVLPKACTP